MMICCVRIAHTRSQAWDGPKAAQSNLRPLAQKLGRAKFFCGRAAVAETPRSESWRLGGVRGWASKTVPARTPLIENVVREKAVERGIGDLDTLPHEQLANLREA
jgi:hypothetical protein